MAERALLIHVASFLAILATIGCGGGPTAGPVTIPSQEDGGMSTRVVLDLPIYPCQDGGACPPNSECGAQGVCIAKGRCSPPCGLGTYCGHAAVCLPVGVCGVSEDCAPHQSCSSNKRCLTKGSCMDALDCEGGMQCKNQLCVPGSECGSQAFTLSSVPPNGLILLDRSGSMAGKVKADDLLSKWEVAIAAVAGVTGAHRGEIRWGLGLFPDADENECEQGALTVPVGPNTEAEINTILQAALNPTDDNYATGNVTNIDAAMARAAAEGALREPERTSFILLLTDGNQSGCSLHGGDTGTLGLVKTLYDDRQIKTFVVGFGGGVDATFLGVLANAGGTATGGQPGFYQANNKLDLEAALAGVAVRSAGCEFSLRESVGDPAQIYVFFDDKTAIARDPTHREGWDYDLATGTLRFFGSACGRLQNGLVQDLDVVFGCPKPIIDL